MSETLIRLEDINMIFYKTNGIFAKEKCLHVLKDINLEIKKGEIVAIVGESGCGKTTLGKIITGLTKPSSGDVYFHGESIKNQTSKSKFRDAVQFIQQDSYAALNPVKTIFQSISAPIKSKNKNITKEEIYLEVKKLLEDVELRPAEQFMDKYPHQLSGGQRQRILMSRALTQNPEIIVADEPVSMIDVSLRLSILNLMSKLNKERGISFIYITHDLGTARYITNHGRLAVMYLGEIIEIGKMGLIIDEPKHPYTQALLSAVPIPNPVLARQALPIKIKSMELMSLENRDSGCSFYGRCPYSIDSCKEKDIEYIEQSNRLIKCLRVKEIPKFDYGYKK